MWSAREEAGRLPEGIGRFAGCLRQVWPEERLTEEEARWILDLRQHMSWRALAAYVVGDGNQITGMGLEQAARPTLRLDADAGG